MSKNKTRKQNVDLVPLWIEEFDPQMKAKYDDLVKRLTTILKGGEFYRNSTVRKIPGYVFDVLTNPNAGKESTDGRQNWLYYLYENLDSIEEINPDILENVICTWHRNNYRSPMQIIQSLMRSWPCLDWTESDKEFVKDRILRVFGGGTQQSNVEVVQQQKPAMINIRVDEKEKKMYLTTGDTCISLEFDSKL